MTASETITNLGNAIISLANSKVSTHATSVESTLLDLKDTIDDIIEEGGGVIPTPTGTLSINQNGTYNVTNYASANVNVSSGGGSSSYWQDPDWWDVKSVLENDTEDYAGKAIILYPNTDKFTTFTITSPIVAVATSDGSFYTTSTTHTWDTSKDKIANSDIDDTTPKYGTRYVIIYFNTANVNYLALNNYSNASIYAVFKCNITKDSASGFQPSFFYSNPTIQSFDFVNGYNVNFGVNLSFFCFNCMSLKKLPDDIDVSSATNFSYFCYYCFSLIELPNNLDVSNGTTFTYFCGNDYSLAKLPDLLDLSNATEITALCTSCGALTKANIKLADLSLTTISSCPLLSIQSLEYIANNAPTVSNKTLTIGNTNITRAGGASGNIITTLTNKGWTVN